MNTNNIVGIGITAAIIVVVIMFGIFKGGNNNPSTQKDSGAIEEGSILVQDKINNEGVVIEKKEVNIIKSGSYEVYSPEKIALASSEHDVVLFFNAGWCPTCRALNKDITNNSGNIPASLTILSVDYDNSQELKQKYGVTYQHTLVQVDKDGNMIKKWNGSPTLAKLVSEVQ